MLSSHDISGGGGGGGGPGGGGGRTWGGDLIALTALG